MYRPPFTSGHALRGPCYVHPHPSPVTHLQALFNAVGAGAPDAVLWLLASGLVKDVNAQAETIEASAVLFGVGRGPLRNNTHAHFAGHFLWLVAAFWRSRRP